MNKLNTAADFLWPSSPWSEVKALCNLILVAQRGQDCVRVL